jgi:hypothetical protein
MATTPPGAPKLWNQPLSPQIRAAANTVSVKPMARLQKAVSRNAAARKRRILAWSARKPLVSLPIA